MVGSASECTTLSKKVAACAKQGVTGIVTLVPKDGNTGISLIATRSSYEFVYPMSPRILSVDLSHRIFLETHRYK